MVDSDISLNHGCIKPNTPIIPERSLLKPSIEASVCAGIVLTSQRIFDVMFRAFRTCVVSQGCMNSFTFGFNGENGLGYYETISGGSGGGPSWAGTDDVHTNMTNTRSTNAESLERRYPVVLRRFCFRQGSAGYCAFPGGEGVVRDVKSRLPMSVSILSERCSFASYGMEGGADGKRRRNTWVQPSGRQISIGGKSTVWVGAGDRLGIETPGRGGYGSKSEARKGDELKRVPSFVPIAGVNIEAIRSPAEQV